MMLAWSALTPTLSRVAGEGAVIPLSGLRNRATVKA